MIVGCLQVTLSIPAARSLKDKRKVVRSCIDRVRARFKVAVAEVGANDEHTRSVIGVAAVANEGPFVNSVLDKVIAFVESDTAGAAEIVDSSYELVHL